MAPFTLTYFVSSFGLKDVILITTFLSSFGELGSDRPQTLVPEHLAAVGAAFGCLDDALPRLDCFLVDFITFTLYPNTQQKKNHVSRSPDYVVVFHIACL